MTTPAEVNGLSILDLVASDAAYKTLSVYMAERAANGGRILLQSLPDSSTAIEEQGVPQSLLTSLPNGAEDLTAWQLAFRDGSRSGSRAQVVVFDNWELIKKFQDDSDGFGRQYSELRRHSRMATTTSSRRSRAVTVLIQKIGSLT